jgi:adenylate kinase family enzyme
MGCLSLQQHILTHHTYKPVRSVRAAVLVHTSVDLSRGEQQRDSPQVLLMKNYIKEGKIVPVEITCGLLLKSMTELEETQTE